MMKRKTHRRTFTALGILVLLVGIVSLPPVWSRVSWHVDQWRTSLNVYFHPPQDVAFASGAGQATQGTALPLPLVFMSTLPVTPTAPSLPTATALPATPTPTSTPLPQHVALGGVRYTSQKGYYNYCAPANLAMMLSFWGWSGKMTDIGAVVKPDPQDKNVMPYELEDYARTHAGLGALTRVGGTLDDIERLVANGFPVLTEMGVYFNDIHGQNTWMGHYRVITGYDLTKGVLIAQDSYIQPNYEVPFDDFVREWRSFNYTYTLVYPPDEEPQVMALLGPAADPAANARAALATAQQELGQLSGVDQFFAWFNYATNLVALQDYTGAAREYDTAFRLYNALPKDQTLRPFRILWYETGPFKAYYYTGRYQQVIDLATNNSIGMVRDDEPALEESFYWRGMAEAALGETQSAVDDLHTSLTYHPGFQPSLLELQQLGVNP